MIKTITEQNEKRDRGKKHDDMAFCLCALSLFATDLYAKLIVKVRERKQTERRQFSVETSSFVRTPWLCWLCVCVLLLWYCDAVTLCCISGLSVWTNANAYKEQENKRWKKNHPHTHTHTTIANIPNKCQCNRQSWSDVTHKTSVQTIFTSQRIASMVRSEIIES